MELAILLSLAASLCTATSSVCQRLGAQHLEAPRLEAPRLEPDGGPEVRGFDPWLVFRLARQPVWLLGFGCMIAGFVFQVSALHFGPLRSCSRSSWWNCFWSLVTWRCARTGGAVRRVRGREWGAAVAMSAGISVLPARRRAVRRPRARAGAARGGCRSCGPGGRGGRGRRVRGRDAAAPRRLARYRDRHRLGVRGRRDQGAELAHVRRPGGDLRELVGLRAGRCRRGRDAADLARDGGGARSPRRSPDSRSATRWWPSCSVSSCSASTWGPLRPPWPPRYSG